jgi:hypothetical protein
MLCRENMLNIFGLGWSWTVLDSRMGTLLTFVTGATLIWMNIERALKARNSRKKQDD